jgi:REP-associated tyrosine transposase
MIMASFDLNSRRLRLVEKILHLSEGNVADLEQLLQLCADANVPVANAPGHSPDSAAGPPFVERDWPHAPLHRLSTYGTYIVTAGTYQKQHYFRGPDRLDHLEATLLSVAKEAGWQVEAWAVFSNHYHFVAHAQPGCQQLKDWIAELHRRTATYINELDKRLGRRVWFNYRDTELTFETSYLARLNYVHHNAVKHGLVRVANQYRWCSAAWFERTASPAQVRTIYGFKIDQINVPDDFDPA